MDVEKAAASLEESAKILRALQAASPAPQDVKPAAIIAAVVFAIITLAPALADAQATVAVPAMTIDLSSVISTVVLPIATSIVLGLAGWAMTRIAALCHFQVQDGQRDLVDNAITNGLAYAQSLLGPAEKVASSQTVATAVQYVLPKIPQTLAALGVTPAALEHMVLAKLGAPA